MKKQVFLLLSLIAASTSVQAWEWPKLNLKMFDPRSWNWANLYKSDKKPSIEFTKETIQETNKVKKDFQKTEIFKNLEPYKLSHKVIAKSIIASEQCSAHDKAVAERFLKSQSKYITAPVFEDSKENEVFVKHGKVALGGSTILAGLGLFGYQGYKLLRNIKKETWQEKRARLGKMALACLITVGGVGFIGHTLQ